MLDRLTATFDATFVPLTHVVLAVSGGADSTALMHLAATWKRARDPALAPTFSVVTIDHALRTQSAAEAATVAAAAGRLGFEHTTLIWSGSKPTRGVQAAARNARHVLIRAHLQQNGWPAVAMAHTADDQAETLLMRLARGSGIDGLAAMRPVMHLDSGHTIVRPLLEISKTDLMAWLQEQTIPWLEDPSNHSGRFERVRVRRARAALAAEGVDLESAALVRTARRMDRARIALERATQLTWDSRGTQTRIDPLGFAMLDWDWLLAEPEEIRLRLLAGLLEAVGGQGPVSLGQLERHTIERDWQPLNATLHGVQVEATRAGLRFMREPGRIAPAAVPLTLGAPVIWDGRFQLIAHTKLAEPLTIAALGLAGLRTLRQSGTPVPQVTSSVLRCLPALWSKMSLVGVPSLAARNPAPNIACRFIGPAFDFHYTAGPIDTKN